MTRRFYLNNIRNYLSITLFAVSTVLLVSCGGGTGSADGQSVFGADGDPFSSAESLETVANSLGFATPIVYVRRPLPIPANPVTDPLDWLELADFNPGATLHLRSTATLNGTEFNLTDSIFGQGAQYDVKDVSVSPNGEKLLFALHQPEADIDNPVFTWNIWEYDLINNSMRRIISNDLIIDDGHDINPIYLANGDILFASTRQSTNQDILVDEGKRQYLGQIESVANDSVEPDPAFNLHVIDANEKITQITFNQSHDFSPVVQNNGKILFMRWDNIAGTDRLSFYEIDPDGNNLALKYGYNTFANVNNGGNGFVTRMRRALNGNILGITQERPNTLFTLGGDIVEVDVENFVDNNTPTFPNIGLLTSATTSLTPSGVAVDNSLSPNGRYLSAWPLDDGSGRILTVWSDCRATDTSAAQPLVQPCSLAPPSATAAEPNFGVWMYNPAESTQRPVVQVASGEMISEVIAMEAITAAGNVADPINQTLADDQQAILNIRSIYDMDGVDITPAGIAALADPGLTAPDSIDAKFLRLIKAVSIPDEDIYNFDSSAFGVEDNQLMREIVGYVPIEPDGSVRAIVPANVPLTFSVVDRDGKRINIENPNISLRHNNWIHLSPGSTMDCRGCHARNSTTQHGRLDAQAPSVHAGGTVTLPYPNTEPALFAPNGGETMAEIFAAANGIAGRTPSIDIQYSDDWTDDSGSLTKAASFSLLYGNLTYLPASPASANCDDVTSTAMPPPAWQESCRSVINYEQHIQPIWEEPRTPIDDGSGMNTVDTCVGCHTTNGNSQVPSAQLDLTSTPSDVNADHFTSYRELLRGDIEQVVNGTAVANRVWECNQVDGNNQAVVDPMSDPLNPTFLREFRNPTVPASLSEAGANFGASPNFFNCMTQDNACRDNLGIAPPAGLPDECVEFGGAPVITWPTINHNGLLTPDELRLIAEWLDIGAQYYNNPLAAPLQ